MVQRSKIGFGEKRGQNADQKDTFDASEYLLVSNFGLQGSTIFSSQEDYDRFEAYLYLLNAVDGPRASNFFLDGRGGDVFTAARGDTLVAIGAYSFTPKRFFVLVKPLAPNGVAKFMQKLQTAYTMYFNLKYQRTGRIFHAGYHSEVPHSESQLKYFFASVHLHPTLLFNENWEEANDFELRLLAEKAAQYRYSSFGEYVRKEFSIVAPNYFPKFVHTAKQPHDLAALWKRTSSGLKKAQKAEKDKK